MNDSPTIPYTIVVSYYVICMVPHPRPTPMLLTIPYYMPYSDFYTYTHTPQKLHHQPTVQRKAYTLKKEAHSTAYAIDYSAYQYWTANSLLIQKSAVSTDKIHIPHLQD